ncbi:hypothetical protein SAMN04488503_0361 [Humidesulfovibrio mexicanus]|uniref:Uncharacterized protein n=1 Tax=Humidesulfovibrio mexicanus TaxID=147047 RepID=A0A238XR08_9BACT|nr:hypothetical protein SAMN04488503_0361 [Humidesulfovibrio mexicanus]
MTALKTPCAAWAASGRAVSSVVRSVLPVLRLGLASLLLVLIAWPQAVQAERVRVRAASDVGLPLSQGRQQALERGVAEAVLADALRLLSHAPPEKRLDALRAYLTPISFQFVQTYQEVAQPQLEAHASSAPQPASASVSAPVAGPAVELELDVETNRHALRQTVLRLGFLSGERHPGGCTLHRGAGVSQQDANLMREQDVLLGLDEPRQGVQLPEVTVERVPQGYYKAVLRQGQVMIAADSSSLPALWLDVWGRYFSVDERLHGPGKRQMEIVGFSNADGVVEFLHVLAGWDKDVQDPCLNQLQIGAAGVSAVFSCRVANPKSFGDRLDAALKERGLSLLEQAGGSER